MSQSKQLSSEHLPYDVVFDILTRLPVRSLVRFSLAVFKGSLALFVCGAGLDGDSDICYIWVMREYGVVESWTKISVPLDSLYMFFGCTDSGELLIDTYGRGFADLMENLVLLNQLRWNLMQLCVFERNLREATKTSSYACPLRAEYPSFPYVQWTGGAVEADFFEESCSLIGSMKNWICSSSQSSFSRLNKLSHEINFLRNRMESQASTIRSLEAGGSSDPIPDAAGEGSSRRVKRLAPEHPSHPQVRESTTLATLRSKSGHLHSGEQITLDDDNEEDKEDTTPFPWKSVLETVTQGVEDLLACWPGRSVPSLPSWEVQVTNDFGEGETMIVPRSKHVPYVPWTGRMVEADFVEECYSLIGSMKNWISSSSQSSFARLSHEIDLLGGKSSKYNEGLLRLDDQEIPNPIPDAAGCVTPSPADEGNPMNTTVQSNKGSSQRVKCLAPERPSCPQVRESTALATLRSKSGHLHSGEQITLDDDVEEDKEDTTPLVQRQSKRVRL
uniref:F-box associated domain-containing protein n=1 Tax=Fagus sylvatica TaxID=28930 RepID=A0A2N9H4F2_FAGSY